MIDCISCLSLEFGGLESLLYLECCCYAVTAVSEGRVTRHECLSSFTRRRTRSPRSFSRKSFRGRQARYLPVIIVLIIVWRISNRFAPAEGRRKLDSLVSCCKTKGEETVVISYLIPDEEPWCIQSANANHSSTFHKVSTQIKTFQLLIPHARLLMPRFFLSIVRQSFVQRNSVFFLALELPNP